MRYTFNSDECMVITIPLGSLGDAKKGQDVYKIFLKGQPKALGLAQLFAGVLMVSLALLNVDISGVLWYSLPGVWLVLSGMLTYAAGRSPNMCVTKLSFVCNIISFLACLSFVIAASIFLSVSFLDRKASLGIQGIIVALWVIEMFIALFLIYWESKAVCRQHFNFHPIITFKEEVGN